MAILHGYQCRQEKASSEAITGYATIAKHMNVQGPQPFKASKLYVSPQPQPHEAYLGDS